MGLPTLQPEDQLCEGLRKVGRPILAVQQEFLHFQVSLLKKNVLLLDLLEGFFVFCQEGSMVAAVS